MSYFDELQRAMEWLGSKENTFFLGQAVEYAGTAITNTLKPVPKHKLLEVPVAEDMQMGISIGLALNNIVPISIFPRWNFLLLATNQIVNHLDKISQMSKPAYIPKVIIRTSIGSEIPLHPQHQHVGDFSEAFKLMCKNVSIVRLDESNQIFPEYIKAYTREDGMSTILVEWGDFYNIK
jgi:pyruvate/2-oxoglutarate/acetoin dehydrogenase E1 component